MSYGQYPNSYAAESDEVWKPVLGYEGLYEVSNIGRVRSLYYKLVPRVRMLKLSCIGKNRPYYGVSLCRNGTKSTRLVHRLVLDAFVGPGNGLTGSHLNHISTDNRLSNLCWETQAENNFRSRRDGRQCVPGESVHNAKFSNAEAEFIRRILAGGSVSQSALAKSLRVSQTTLSKIFLGQAYPGVL